MAECRAAVITAFNKPLEVRNVQMPDPEPGGMIARVDAATLCGTDIHRWHGMASPDIMPFIPGHETCGTITQMNGPRTDLLGNLLKAGDRVLWAYFSCGQCYWCNIAKQPSICPRIGYWGCNRADQYPYLLGGCAEYQYVPPRSDVIRVPDILSDATAAAAACAYRTVMHGFERLGNINPHETVVVQGSGPLGLYASVVARHKSARKVLVVGAPRIRLDVAEKLGADAVLDIDEVKDEKDRLQWVHDHTDGRGADIVIQCATLTAVPEGVNMVRRGGRYLSIGAGGGGDIPASAMMRHIIFTSVLIAEPRHWQQAVDFIAARPDVPWDSMISAEYTLEQITDAFEVMSDYRVVKPVIYPHGKR